MAFWKIKFGKKKINLFKGVCMFMLTESVNKSFLLTLSSYLVLWLWRQRVALMKESLSGFSLERDSRPSVGHELWLWKKRNLPDRVSATALLTSWLNGLVLVNGSLTVCYLYRNSGSENRPKILARRHLLTNQICILLFYFRASIFSVSWLPILFF